jgi:hypothetical protein
MKLGQIPQIPQKFALGGKNESALRGFFTPIREHIYYYYIYIYKTIYSIVYKNGSKKGAGREQVGKKPFAPQNDLTRHKLMDNSVF